MDYGGIMLEERMVIVKLRTSTVVTNQMGFSIHIVITGIMMMIVTKIIMNLHPLLPLLAVSALSVI